MADDRQSSLGLQGRSTAATDHHQTPEPTAPDRQKASTPRSPARPRTEEGARTSRTCSLHDGTADRRRQSLKHAKLQIPCRPSCRMGRKAPAQGASVAQKTPQIATPRVATVVNVQAPHSTASRRSRSPNRPARKAAITAAIRTMTIVCLFSRRLVLFSTTASVPSSEDGESAERSVWQLSTELPHNLYGLLRLRLPDGGRTQNCTSGSLCVHRDALLERGSAARRPLGPVLLPAAIACRDGLSPSNRIGPLAASRCSSSVPQHIARTGSPMKGCERPR